MITLYEVFYAVSIFLRILRTAILVYVVLSWFRPRFKAFYLLENFVRPFIMPFRRLSIWLMSKFRMPLDFSCYFALVGISLLQQLWWRLYFLLARIP